MEIFKKKNKNGATLLHKRSSAERALFDWKIMLTVFAFLLAVVVLCDGYLLLLINRGDFFASNEIGEVSPVTRNRKVLLDVTAFFDTRQKTYNAFVAAPPSEVDPSN